MSRVRKNVKTDRCFKIERGVNRKQLKNHNAFGVNTRLNYSRPLSFVVKNVVVTHAATKHPNSEEYNQILCIKV